MAAAMRRSRCRRPSLPACAASSPPMRPLMSGAIIRSGSHPNSNAPSGPARPRRGRRSRGARPVDLRANTLKADRDKVLKALRRFEPQPTPHSPVRRAHRAGAGAGQEPACRGRARPRQGLVRGAGRGLPTRHAAFRRAAAAADHRSVRRGRRQDLGARGADGKYRASSMPTIPTACGSGRSSSG